VQRPVHSRNLPSYLANSRRTRDARSAALSRVRFGIGRCIGFAVLWIMTCVGFIHLDTRKPLPEQRFDTLEPPQSGHTRRQEKC
jgi:hypothetical protein